MRSVGEALELLLQSLELTRQQRERVTHQHEVVRQELRQRLAPQTDFLSGSYSRNTSIRPLHDIDVFVVLGTAEFAPPVTQLPPRDDTRQGLTPDKVLKQVRHALKEAWPQKKLPILQRHSVHTKFLKSGIEFDLVPAYARPDGRGYLIPERESGLWIHTDPKLHETLSIQANERAGKKLKPLIKLMKLWNRRQQSSPLRSFHLETMSYDAFATPPEGYFEGLERLFSHLARRVMRPCPDPAQLGPDVDASMSDTQREAARQLLESAARTVRRVLEERDSAPARAHSRLRVLFGERYPEQGE